MNKVIAIILILLVSSFTQLVSFPGDRNSLTCINNLFIAPSSDFANVGELKTGLYSEDLTLRAKALSYVEINKDAINAKIKNSHDMSLDITVWGDSLSDLIDFYGAVPFNWFGAPHIPIADYGNEPGYIDSFGDYFTIFGNFYPDHFIM